MRYRITIVEDSVAQSRIETDDIEHLLKRVGDCLASGYVYLVIEDIQPESPKEVSNG